MLSKFFVIKDFIIQNDKKTSPTILGLFEKNRFKVWQLENVSRISK